MKVIDIEGLKSYQQEELMLLVKQFLANNNINFFTENQRRLKMSFMWRCSLCKKWIIFKQTKIQM